MALSTPGIQSQIPVNVLFGLTTIFICVLQTETLSSWMNFRVVRGNGAVEPRFQTASDEGTRVFFTDTQRLTKDSEASNEKPDLYECEMLETANTLSCKLTDLTSGVKTGESADVQGLVPGSSENGTYIYFVADGVLAADAVPGDCGVALVPAEETCSLYEIPALQWRGMGERPYLYWGFRA